MTTTTADMAGLLAALEEPAEPAGVCQRPAADTCLRRWPRHRHVWCWPCLARADWAEARAAWEAGLPLARLALADWLEENGWPAEGWEALALAVLSLAAPALPAPSGWSALAGYGTLHLARDGGRLTWHPLTGWVRLAGRADWADLPRAELRRPPAEVRAAALAAALAALRAG